MRPYSSYCLQRCAPKSAPHIPTGKSPRSTSFRLAQPPTGEAWLHEIKHDGFRVVARKDGTQVKLYSRPGNDLTYRFTLIVETLARLRSRSCIIDGEAGVLRRQGPLINYFGVDRNPRCLGLRIWCDLAAL